MFLIKRPDRLAALAAIGGLAAAALTAPTGAATGTPAVDPSSSAIVVDAGYLRLGMDRSGQVTSLVDMRSARDHIATGQGTAPLVSLLVDGTQVMPSALRSGGSKLTFTGAGGFEVVVEVEDRTTYTTFEITEATAPNGGDLQAVLWGPLPTSITHTLGESVGIVRDTEFALGMKPLTDRTEGGWPRELWNTPTGWQNQVAGNPSKVTVAPLEEWSVGARTPWGTLLRAFTFDYTKPRTRMAVSYGGTPFPMPVGTLPADIANVTGSKIALYGTTPDMAPTVLSNIAQEQDLPYPTIGGQWQKTAQATNQSMLILEDLDTGNVAQGAQFAVAGGMSLIDGLRGVGGPWRTNGHYQFHSAFGGSDSEATELVNTAEAHGVRVAVHTLSSFIDGDDPYVVSPANDDLAYGLSTTLAQGIGTTGNTIYLTSCAPLDTTMPGDRIRIDDEFLAYGGYREVNGQCEVTGVVRGRWSSAAAAHETGATVRRVGRNPYGGAIGGLPIIDAIATRFATVWNTTGIAGMSFDGLEEAATTGWGSYGISRLVNGTFRQQTNPDGFISETSRMTSNVWDALSRASWGESFNNIDQLFINNLYYDANYLPGALGWIHISGHSNVQSVEDLLARGAGLNAGANFRAWIASLEGGPNTAKVLEAIKQWETARNLGAFTAEQRAKLQDRSTHWHLSVVTPGERWSLQELNAAGQPVGDPQAVVAPTPELDAGPLPAAARGALYEARVTTNTPTTTRYAVTSGTLPEGLVLNADTGGIVGRPDALGTARFTITAYQSAGLPTAQRDYEIDVARTPEPHLTLTTAGSAAPGVTTQAETRLTVHGSKPITDVQVTLTAPAGWTVEATALATFGRLPQPGGTRGRISPSETVTTTWQVSIPADAVVGEQELTATVHYVDRNSQRSVSATTSLQVALENAALGKEATQKSTLWDSPASNAVDGNTDGRFSGGSITHTAVPETEAWWQVDLGTSRTIDSVDIWNGTEYYGNRMKDFWVIASDQPITTDSLAEARATPGATAIMVAALTGRPSVVDVPDGTTARYVRIQLASTINPLSLAEVQVHVR
ncbi:NEW3 domain-containing protein [Jiangella alba]|uniref:Putative Ig domain-containing protein n=1 Tax=Jiangella alba TaxID=561176 RepID=A0A1H5JG89_9ACTN|nr:NEW3 domain-containing protein [Jiangella alba]SEE51237.1 Putative Ig domain-containing protein [Jiangella alba]